MFQRKTTIVVGAGASNEYGLPLGGKLTEDIARDVNIKFSDFRGGERTGDEFIIEALRQAAKAEKLSQSINDYLPACHEIAAGMSEAQSIDTFIHSRGGDAHIELVGKLGILRSILRAERESDLWVDPQNIYNKIEFGEIQDTWLPKLRKFVCDGVRKKDVAERFANITLIVFNYDRCVEHYLVNSLMNYYSIKEDEAIEIFDSLTIIHPYGVVGSLPWQDRRQGIAYGQTEIHNRLLPLVGGIRTFTEQADDDELTDSIQSAIDGCGLLIFLGFAYHDQNIELLVPRLATHDRHIYGTAFEIADPVRAVLEKRLSEVFCDGRRGMVKLDRNCKCKKLLDEYGGVFSAL